MSEGPESSGQKADPDPNHTTTTGGFPQMERGSVLQVYLYTPRRL